MFADDSTVTTPLPAGYVTDLTDLTEQLKRRLAVPGEFATLFPSTTDDDLAGTILDGFARAQLDGFFVSPSVYYATDDGVVTPPIKRAEGALICLYAAIEVTRQRLMNLAASTRYKAGNVEYDVSYASNVLTAALKQMYDEKQAIFTRQQLAGATAAFTMADLFFVKAVGYYPGTEALYYGPEMDRAMDYHAQPWPLP